MGLGINLVLCEGDNNRSKRTQLCALGAKELGPYERSLGKRCMPEEKEKKKKESSGELSGLRREEQGGIRICGMVI